MEYINNKTYDSTVSLRIKYGTYLTDSRDNNNVLILEGILNTDTYSTMNRHKLIQFTSRVYSKQLLSNSAVLKSSKHETSASRRHDSTLILFV